MGGVGNERDSRIDIRLARRDELQGLQEIEDLAGQLYATAGLPDDLPGLSMTTLEAAHAERLVWVAVAADDTPIAFALCWLRPNTIHLREIDVHPDHARRGIGRTLIEFVVREAERRGSTHVTLTTFRDIPWNAPLYERYGFTKLDASDWPDWMHDIREDERAEGLDRWPRVAMARAVSA